MSPHEKRLSTLYPEIRSRGVEIITQVHGITDQDRLHELRALWYQTHDLLRAIEAQAQWITERNGDENASLRCGKQG